MDKAKKVLEEKLKLVSYIDLNCRYLKAHLVSGSVPEFVHIADIRQNLADLEKLLEKD